SALNPPVSTTCRSATPASSRRWSTTGWSIVLISSSSRAGRWRLGCGRRTGRYPAPLCRDDPAGRLAGRVLFFTSVEGYQRRPAGSSLQMYYVPLAALLRRWLEGGIRRRGDVGVGGIPLQQEDVTNPVVSVSMKVGG